MHSNALQSESEINRTRDAHEESIPEADEALVQDMWKEVRKNAKENWSDDNISPPFLEMDLDSLNGSKN